MEVVNSGYGKFKKVERGGILDWAVGAATLGALGAELTVEYPGWKSPSGVTIRDVKKPGEVVAIKVFKTEQKFFGDPLE